jgi:DNA-binding transcriptional ArsR family regulator
MLLAQMDRETRLGNAIPSDCRAVLAPLVKAEQEITDEERHLLRCFSRREADVIDICEAAEMAGVEPGAVEYVLEALADVHLIEPLVLGRYRLPRLVRIYFGWRAPVLTS